MIALSLALDDLVAKKVPDAQTWLNQKESLKQFFAKFKMTPDVFENLFLKYTLIPFEAVPVKSNGKLRETVGKYGEYHISHEKLFTDYCAACDISGEPLNPWSEWKAKFSIRSKTSLATEEMLFDCYVWEVRNQKASDVIRYLFYPSYKNDSAIETGFILRRLFNEGFTSNVTVFNPSPDMILSVKSKMKPGWADYTFPDSSFAEAYNKEFGSNDCGTLDKFSSACGVVLINMTADTAKDMDLIFETLKVRGVNKILMLVPNAVVEDKKELLFGNAEGYHIQSITVLETDMTRSTPRKKVFVVLERKKCAASIPTYFLKHYDPDHLYIENSFVAVSSDLYITSKTIMQAWKKAIESPEKKMRRNPPKIYNYSPEIQVLYRFKSKKGDVSAVASYTAHPNNGSKTLLKNIEKGLRVSEEKDLFPRLDTLVLDKDIYHVIRKDILTAFEGNTETVSLKTLWYIVRDELLTKKKYDEEKTLDLFSGSKEELEEMKVSDMDLGIVAGYIEKKTENATQEERYKFWEQLSLIFSVGAENKYVRFNPISEILRKERNVLSDEQREVHNALTKKHFTVEEMKRLLCGEKTNYDWTNEDSLESLIVVLRLFTAIVPKEMQALTWSDIEYIREIGTYQIRITKFYDEEGKHISYGLKEDWTKFRRIPLATQVATVLNGYKKRLQDRYGLSDKEMLSIPIFCKGIDKRKNKQDIISSWIINKVCRDAVEALDVEELKVLLPGEKEYLTDLNKYRSDKFTSNFKYYANHYCLMSRGEINYLLGLEAPDTYSKHYCDYGNDYIQLAMKKKLERLVNALLPETGFDKGKKTESGIVSGRGNYASAAEMKIQVNEPTDIHVRVSTRYGARGFVVMKENDDDNAE